MRKLFCLALVFLCSAVAALAQYFVPALASATLQSSASVQPGDTVSIAYSVAPGGIAPQLVSFTLGMPGPNGSTITRAVSAANASSGVATVQVDADWPDGTYSCYGYVMEDASGVTYLYDGSGRLTFNGGPSLYPNPAPAVDLSGLRITVSGGITTPVVPSLVSFTRTSPDSLVAGQPATFTARIAAGTSKHVYVHVDVTRPDYWLEARANAEADITGTGDVLVSLPTDASWSNGQYTISDINVGDVNLQTNFGSASSGVGTDIAAAAFNVTGGVDSYVYPRLVSISRTSPATVSPGQPVTLQYSITPGTVAVDRIEISYHAPTTNSWQKVVGTGASDTGTITVDSSWMNDTYIVAGVYIYDANQREVWYSGGNIYDSSLATPHPDGFPFTSYSFTVTGASTIPPVIAAQPTSISFTPGAGTTPTLSVTADSHSPVSYQWYQGQAGDTSKPLNAMGSQLNVGELPSTTTYWVRITSSSTTLDSSAATVTVNYPSTSPAVIRQPSGFTRFINDGGQLSAYVVGPPPLTYQWYHDGAAVAGATNSQLQFTPGQVSDSGSYVLTATNGSGSASTQPAIVSIEDTPAVSLAPATQAVRYGSSVTLTATATGGNLNYSWRHNTSQYNNAGATFTIPNFGFDDVGYYTVQAGNDFGSASATAELTMIGGPAPVVTLPANPTATVGHLAEVQISATNAPLTYSATGLPPGLHVSGDGFIQGYPTTVATYHVTVSVDNGQAIGSATADIVVQAGLEVTPTPQSQTITPGSTALINVPNLPNAIGYQWYQGTSPDDSHPIPGATTYGYLTPALSQTATYWVEVWFADSRAYSSTAVVNVAAAATPPTILSAPVSTRAGLGSEAQFTVVASGSTPLSYQWEKDGAAIAGATTSTLTINPVQASDAGSYRVQVSNSVGAVLSDPATLDIPVMIPGAYFGTIGSGSSEPWALYVRPDLSGVLIAYEGAQDPIVATIHVAADGTFTSQTTTASALPLGASHTLTTASPLISGSITAAGVTGSIALNGGAAAPMSGAADASTGSTSSFAGIYTAQAIGNSSGTATLVVGPTGHALLVMDNLSAPQAVAGTIGANGSFTQTWGAGTAAMSLTGASKDLSVTFAATGTSAPLTFAGLPDGTVATAHLANVSARAAAGSGDNTLIVGFVVAGSGSKQVLVRAVGPGLATYGVTNYLPDPQLALYTSDNQRLAENDNWGGGPSLSNAFRQVGAFDLNPSSTDAALLQTLPAAAYTAQATATSGSGVVLVECYDADSVSSPTRYSNLSVRSYTGVNEQVLTAGFVVTGDGPRQLLIRGIGPGLIKYGVGGTVADPQLTLYKGTNVIAQNDNWSGDPALVDAFKRTGAFDLPATSTDAAMFVTLLPGSYTVQVAGVNDTTGVALAEVYEMR